MKWRKITIFLHFAATIEEALVIWSHPAKEKQYSFFEGLYCPAVHTLLILPLPGKNTQLEKEKIELQSDGTACATFPK